METAHSGVSIPVLCRYTIVLRHSAAVGARYVCRQPSEFRKAFSDPLTPGTLSWPETFGTKHSQRPARKGNGHGKFIHGFASCDIGDTQRLEQKSNSASPTKEGQEKREIGEKVFSLVIPAALPSTRESAL